MKGFSHLAIGFVVLLICIVISGNIDTIFSSFEENSRELLQYSFIALGIFSFVIGYARR